ncbi:hypothetical protein GGD66_002247 [Bradyrhizobium sp. CIR48]|uniref:hypothetical protein n=1 Tax=unclassified Bradyrhizobium TaxID=2631580 RepID=UPI001606D10F|nr:MULTISPECIES: hypothetical protein [unclassified Bradyrhizobium]MBB4396612.1 hypothetical protein [Bradyrhizobium sp. ERR14]MBB4423703.1 hypothetical protein [Bradyrhizobium sp. CIR48]
MQRLLKPVRPVCGTPRQHHQRSLVRRPFNEQVLIGPHSKVANDATARGLARMIGGVHPYGAHDKIGDRGEFDPTDRRHFPGLRSFELQQSSGAKGWPSNGLAQSEVAVVAMTDYWLSNQ